jgi:sec-independent protein translocase protein TatA
MGGLSPVHMGLLLVIALLVFGPKKLPEIGRELGQAIREFKKASREVMDSFHEAAADRPYTAPAYDAYSSPPTEVASASPQPEPAPAAEPAVLPAGVVERPAVAATAPLEAAPASSAAPAAQPEPVSHEPGRDPAALERNT